MWNIVYVETGNCFKWKWLNPTMIKSADYVIWFSLHSLLSITLLDFVVLSFSVLYFIQFDCIFHTLFCSLDIVYHINYVFVTFHSCIFFCFICYKYCVMCYVNKLFWFIESLSIYRFHVSTKSLNLNIYHKV